MSKRDTALAEALANYAAKRPKTAALHARAKAVMPGGNTRTVLYHGPFPIRAAKASYSCVRLIEAARQRQSPDRSALKSHRQPRARDRASR